MAKRGPGRPKGSKNKRTSVKRARACTKIVAAGHYNGKDWECCGKAKRLVCHIARPKTAKSETLEHARMIKAVGLEQRETAIARRTEMERQSEMWDDSGFPYVPSVSGITKRRSARKARRSKK
jgi:hypothetical protein